MAVSKNPVDIYASVNAIVKQATGRDDISVYDTSSFISAGELAMETGTENVLNSMSYVLGKTWMSIQPYKAKLLIINAMNSGVFTNRIRKITPYSTVAEATGDLNTQLFTNLKDGFDNGSNSLDGVDRSAPSMWRQQNTNILEMHYGITGTWQDRLTVYENQLKVIFRDETEFANFWTGILASKTNDIELQKENYRRSILLNHIGYIYNMRNKAPSMACNLTKAFNEEFGTSHKTKDLLTTYLKEYDEFLVSKMQYDSKLMEEDSALYHWTADKNIDGVDYQIIKHTPKADQRFIFNNKYMLDTKSRVLPEIFNPSYLEHVQGEGVNYWQSIKDPYRVNVKPAIFDESTGTQIAGEEVNIPIVIGLLYNKDAMMIDFQLEDVLSTPVEAAKRYRNSIFHFRYGAINDITEPAILYYMSDED